MNRFVRSLLLGLSLVMSCVAFLFAGDGQRSVTAVRVAKAPVVDGTLDEPEWRLAGPASGFTQRDPEEGLPASEQTEIRVLYNDDALFFGCMLHDSDPGKIVSRLTRRDNEVESDRLSIRIDSYHDHQTAFEFTFNVAGVKVDILQYDDGEREDESWDPVWDVETAVTDDGWTAEVRIPFHILRYLSEVGDTDEADWGINFIRYITRRQESARWAFTRKNESGFISRFGHLEGLRNLPPPMAVEILPFVLGRQNYVPSTTIRPRLISFDQEAGLDLRLGLWSNFTINATINPDFGQVEADPAVLNLSTFETFYPEQRPFFVEGTQIIRFSTFGDGSGPGMFYSRRIGRAISPAEVDLPEGGRIEQMPSAATILGAAKFTGKTNDGLSIGVLQATTKEASAVIADSTGRTYEYIVEPEAYFSVLRVRKDILENSNVGMIFTTVAKNSRIPAFTGGWDWNLKLERNTYQLDGFLGLSQTSDAAGNPLSGSAGRLTCSRIAADHWFWSLSTDFTSKRFNINDAGFFRRPNDFGAVTTLRYAENSPSDLLRSYVVGLFLHERRNFDGVNLMRESKVESEFLFSNYWVFETAIGVDAGMYDDRETRGNGLYRRPTRYSWKSELSNDRRDPLVLDAEQEIGWNDRRGFTSTSTLAAEVRPLTWMDWDIEAEYGRVRNEEAWFMNVESGGTTKRIFGDRKTDRLGLTLRTTLTFTRTLTLQMYGQIFLAEGEYDGFRELIGVGDFQAFADPVDGTSFNEKSFNTNIVIRWEYLPGSTLFLVWSHAREEKGGYYSAGFSEDFERTFKAPPSNILLMKISYWWSL